MGSNKFIDNIAIKDMTTEELSQIWEEALYSPIDEPIPQIVADALAELVDREDIK